MSHCPECGRGLQSKRWSRRYGAILCLCGLFISGVMGFVLLLTLPKLIPGRSDFTSSASQGVMVLAIMGAVETFGITAMCYGFWQAVTGRRSQWVIYFAIGLVSLLFLLAFFI